MNLIVSVDNKLLEEEFPYDDPEYIRSENIDVLDLDTYAKKRNILGDNIFLKLDTQGNELNILNSAKKILKAVQVCIIEYMFTNPYNSDYNFLDLVSFIDENNFSLAGPVNITKRPSKKVSAVDFVFYKI